MGALEVIIASVGGSAVIVGAVAWLIRSLTVHVLSKDLESFKTKLESAAYERQVRFAKLHEHRASIIAELYSRLVTLHKSATDFVRWYQSVGNDEKEQHITRLWSAADDFNTYFEKNRIYFDQGTCDKVVSLNDILSRACSVLATFANEREALNISDQQVFEEWQKASNLFDLDIPKVKQTLEDSFRELLGVDIGK